MSTILAGLGIDLAGWELRSAEGVSGDGKVVVGGAKSPGGIDRAFIVRLP